MQRNIRKSEAIDNALFSFFMFRLSLSLLIFDNSSTLFFQPAYDVSDDRHAIDISQVMIPALNGSELCHRLQFLIEIFPCSNGTDSSAVPWTIKTGFSNLSTISNALEELLRACNRCISIPVQRRDNVGPRR